MADGFTQAELVSAGLIKEADEKKGTYYDRFRNRLMFPIRDSAGRTVAFTGRALDPNDQAKYLNSPETDLYKKSEILFGMDKAKDAIRVRGFALLVEGQMDLLMLHQIGFTNAIALSGTALSPQHLALMKRYADNLMLALDSDRAGLAASQKNAITALRSGMRVKAVRMPTGKDPADMALENPKDLTKRIADAHTIVEFFLSVLAENYPDSLRLIVASERAVLPLIASMESAMEREHFVGIVARALQSTPDAVREGLERTRRQMEKDGGEHAPRVSASAPARPQNVPARVSSVGERHAILVRAIAESYPNSALATRLESEYSRIIGSSFPDDLLPEAEVFEAGIAYGENPDEHAADDLIRALEKATLGERLTDVSKRLRQAEASGDEMNSRALADESRTLARQLSEFS
jgi:DNA primase